MQDDGRLNGPSQAEPVASALRASVPDAFNRVPEGMCGEYRIEHFTVSQEQADRSRIRFWRDEYVPAGDYTRLMRGSTVVMSDTPMEVRTNWWIMNKAQGHVLINGLGIGMVLRAVLARNDVLAVTVVEISEEVISLVAPTFQDDPRLTIIHADALEYQPARGQQFDCVWHDIWDYITADNLPEMRRLHRKYGRRAKQQASWCREQCERYAA